VKIIDAAKVCYEANRAYCQTLGDNSFKPWEEAPEWQRETNQKGVQYRLDNPGCGGLEMHNSWMAVKIAEGWVYGETKDAELKTHPCLLSYDRLPREQRIKDDIFSGIVDAITPLIEDWNPRRFTGG
jgi:hypothetical protein